MFVNHTKSKENKLNEGKNIYIRDKHIDICISRITEGIQQDVTGAAKYSKAL